MEETSHKTTSAYFDEDAYCPEPPPPPEPAFWKDGSLRVGIHTSIAGGVEQALERAHALGCTALQIFSMSPRMWPAGKGAPGDGRPSAAQAARFRTRRKQLQLGPLAIHSNYLINLASQNRVIRARSIQAFCEELVRALLLGADYLIMHPGSAGAAPLEEAIGAIADGLQRATRGLKLGELQILLENTAGQGSSIGWRFEHLAAVIRACADLPLGVCLDTAHTFAAGYDICSEAGLEQTLSEFDRILSLERLFVVHVNDSKVRAASRVDRHEHLGRGKIGFKSFRQLLHHPLVTSMPGRAFILETPMDRPGDDLRNVRSLWRLFTSPVPVRSGAKDGPLPNRPKQVKVRSARSKKARRRSSPR